MNSKVKTTHDAGRKAQPKLEKMDHEAAKKKLSDLTAQLGTQKSTPTAAKMNFVEG